jgi:hypothetical protein
MFQLTNVPIVSDIVVTFLRSIAVLTPNGSFSGCATIALSERKCSFSVDTRVVKPDTRVVKPDTRMVKPDTRVVKPDTRVVKPDTRVVKPLRLAPHRHDLPECKSVV